MYLTSGIRITDNERTHNIPVTPEVLARCGELCDSLGVDENDFINRACKVAESEVHELRQIRERYGK